MSLSVSLDYVNGRYGTSYKIGQRVKVDGKAGMIVPRPDSIGEHYVAVQFDVSGMTCACHPTWEFEVLGEAIR